MRINAFWHTLTIPGPEGPKDEVWTLWHWILRQPEDAPVLPLPVSCPHMVGVMRPVESGFLRLLGGKKPSLTFCNGEKVCLGFFG
jgi:hypothetical protein